MKPRCRQDYQTGTLEDTRAHLEDAPSSFPSYLQQEILDMICKMVDSLPEFVHLDFNSPDRSLPAPRLDNAKRVNAITRVCRRLQHTVYLYKNVARLPSVASTDDAFTLLERVPRPNGIATPYWDAIKKATTDFRQNFFPEVGLPAFQVRYGDRRLPIHCRPLVDEFFLTGFCGQRGYTGLCPGKDFGNVRCLQGIGT